MERTRRIWHGAAAAGLSLCLVLAATATTAGAGSAKGRCNPRKTTCTVSDDSTSTSTSTTTSTTSTSTTTTSTTTTTIATDVQAPVVRISSPGNGTYVTGTFTVAGSSSDDRTVAGVEVRVDAGAWQPAQGTTSWSASLDPGSWAAGDHVVSARAVDGAGNRSSVASVTVRVPAASTGDWSIAPATQGTWVSPEGATIEVTTTAAFTIRDVYRLLLENGSAPGDLGAVAPSLTIRLQDVNASQTTTSVRLIGTTYSSFRATIYLKGSGSTFASQPDSQFAHEYGHAWSMYHLYLSSGGDWSSYLGFRWSAPDGSTVLAEDSRLGSSYGWDKAEIIADDYRLLFGSEAAIAQRPTHMNGSIAHPSTVPGLRSFLLDSWAR